MRRALAPEYGVQRVVQLKRLSLVVFAAAAGGDAR
jgi:hypothetical protein